MNGKNTQYVEKRCAICGNVYYRPEHDDSEPATCGKGACPVENMSRLMKARYGNAR